MFDQHCNNYLLFCVDHVRYPNAGPSFKTFSIKGYCFQLNISEKAWWVWKQVWWASVGRERQGFCMHEEKKLNWNSRKKRYNVLALAKESTCEIPESVVSAPSSPTVQDQQAMAMNSQIKEVEDEIKALDHMSISGMQFVIDNFDLRQDVRDMTCENQNKDYHWTNHNCVWTEWQELSWTMTSLYVI